MIGHVDDHSEAFGGDAVYQDYVRVDHRQFALKQGSMIHQTGPAGTAKVRALIDDAERISDAELAELLAPEEVWRWRERLVAAWLAGIGRREALREQIGRQLMRGIPTPAVQGYCFALSCFGTAADADILVAHLEDEPLWPDKHHNRDWVIGALLDVDARLGTRHAARFTSRRQLPRQRIRNFTAEDLPAARDRYAKLRARFEEVRTAPLPEGADHDRLLGYLPPTWTVLGEQGGDFAAELAVEIDAAAAPEHPLTAQPMTPVAHCARRDHVLFAADCRPARWLVVKLTWSGAPEPLFRQSWTVLASPEAVLEEIELHDGLAE